MQPKPYIGVTGFMNSEQIKTALERSNFQEDDGLALMAGVLVSQKTLFGQRKGSKKRHPNLRKIKGIFFKDLRCLNLIHYYCPAGTLTSEQLIQLEGFAGDNLHGFQLNTTWPSPHQLESYNNKSSRGSYLVLQIGRDAFAQIGHDPRKLAERIKKEYADLVDYVLLDSSEGNGEEMHVAKMHEYLSEIYNCGLTNRISLTIAGGFDGDMFRKARTLFANFPGLSTDAEGKLHHPDTNELCMNKVKWYLDMGKVWFKPQWQNAMSKS